MRRTILTSVLAVIAFTVLLGIAYPLVVTGIAQVAFPRKANGDTSLIATDVKNSPRYFHPRPSATKYSANATFFANRGPNQASAAFFYGAQLAAYLKAERPFDPGLTKAGVPADAVTDSGSGVDPDISPANAAIQAHRIASVRRLPLARVQALIDDATHGGLLGPKVVNTTRLNRSLDR